MFLIQSEHGARQPVHDGGAFVGILKVGGLGFRVLGFGFRV